MHREPGLPLTERARSIALDRREIDDVAAALLELGRRAACCSGAPHAIAGDSSTETADRPARRTAARRRHRSRPVSDPRRRRFALVDVTVVEPGVSRETGQLLVADGRVVELAPLGAAIPDGYERIDRYRGCFVAPSLIDMHGHLPPDNVLGLIGRFLLLHLAHGVTTVRDAGDIDGTAIPAVRAGLADGRFIGPRIFAAGPFITKAPARWKNSLFLDGPRDAERIARELAARGLACMKLYENLAPDEIAALERAAAERGLVTLGHVPTKLAYEDAPLADAQHFFGVAPPASLPRDHVLDRSSHWDAVDARREDAIVRAAADGQRANTPTLIATERLLRAGPAGTLDDAVTALLPRFYRDVVWHPRWGLPAYRDPTPAREARLADALEKKLRLVGRLHRAGAPLRLGTDVQQPFVVPGAALHAEMRLFVRAGIPPADVLRMATRDAARALGQRDLGTTRTGARADLIVCDEDPSRDITALSSLRAVAHEGALYDRAALDAELRDDLAVRDRGFERIASHVLGRIVMWRTARGFIG